MSKHNRERREIKRIRRTNPKALLTPYQRARVSKHGKRKLKGQ